MVIGKYVPVPEGKHLSADFRPKDKEAEIFEDHLNPIMLLFV